ncbi:MAG: hypothetical protein E5Y88_16935, partial [Mesorhizobium sp.]
MCRDEPSILRRHWRDSAPLCPAGHLPHKWGDRISSAFADYQRRKLSGTAKLPISPQVGEMSGRTEG